MTLNNEFRLLVDYIKQYELVKSNNVRHGDITEEYAYWPERIKRNFNTLYPNSFNTKDI
jgi:hypothetical protein